MFKVGDRFINASVRNEKFGLEYKVIFDCGHLEHEDGWDYFVQYKDRSIMYSCAKDMHMDINLSDSKVVRFKPQYIDERS